MRKSNLEYIVFSVFLHAGLLAGFGLSTDSINTVPNLDFSAAAQIKKDAVEEEIQIVQAVVIDESELKAEVERLNKLELEEKKNEAARVKKIQAAADKAIKERLAQERKVKDLQSKLKKTKQEDSNLQKKLLAEKKELDKLKQQKQALEAERKKLKEEQKLAQSAKQKVLEEKKQLEQEAKAHELKRKQYVSSEIRKYASLIKQKVGKNWSHPQEPIQNLSSVMMIKASENGEVLEVKLSKSSGSESFDRAAELAVLKSSPLPMPYDDEVLAQFKIFSFTFKPEA